MAITRSKTCSDIFHDNSRVPNEVTQVQILEPNQVTGYKGPVSGFVEHLPLPTLESRINRNHQIGANLTFLFGFCLT